MRRVTIALLCAAGLLAAGCAGTKKEGEIAIVADGDGFTPASVEAPAGKPVTLVFKRTTDATCATEAVFAATGERHDLPLNQEVRVTVTPAAGETLRYACGMNMYLGEIVAK